jgi:hypothetical protein
MFTQELVTSIIAEQEESTDQFVDIIQQKIEDAIEVKRIELASQMFEASKKCPECGKADCECDDEDYEDEEEDDEEEMKEEVEQIDELSAYTLKNAAAEARGRSRKIHNAVGPDAPEAAAYERRAAKFDRAGDKKIRADAISKHSSPAMQRRAANNVKAASAARDASAAARTAAAAKQTEKPGNRFAKVASSILKKIKMREEAEQIDEISKGAAIRAAGVAGSSDDPRTNRIIDRIHKKFGSKASDDAAAHANASYYGRDGKSRGTDPLNSVLDRPSQMRKTKAGKINKQDQKALATSIKGRMKMHGGKSPLPEEFEQMDEQFTLHAVHDEMGTKKKLGSFASKGEAATHLNKLEKAGKFPEGHEAVLTDKNGQKHMYTDKWEQMDEMAPPGAKYERMVKHIKKGYSKGGLTKNERSIAYATAWKAKGREMNEAAMTDAQKMAALGMKGAEKAKTMMALSSYRRHGDINKLSAGHRSLVSSYMEKTGGLEAVNRSAATQALKKERMQEE